MHVRGGFGKATLGDASRLAQVLIGTLLVTSCVQYPPRYVYPPFAQRPPPLPQAAVPWVPPVPERLPPNPEDRLARFRDLTRQPSLSEAEVKQFSAPAGSVPGASEPVPVVLVVFPERVFFEFDSAALRPEAMFVIILIAEELRQDTADVAVTILGHTDGVGTDAYNLTLSRKRTLSVMLSLVGHGVNPAQLSTVAIGRAQPIAPNSSPEGRARNRRVEFMISASEMANLVVIRNRKVDALNFTTPSGLLDAPPRAVEVFKPFFPSEGPPELRRERQLALRTPDQLPGPRLVPLSQLPSPAPPEPVPGPRQPEPLPGPRPPNDYQTQ